MIEKTEWAEAPRPPLRTSKPYSEFVGGLTEVRAGDRVERDDGWWRAMRVTILSSYATKEVWQSEIEWWPV